VIEMDKEMITRIKTLIELVRELSRNSEELVYMVHMNNKFIQRFLEKMKTKDMEAMVP